MPYAAATDLIGVGMHFTSANALGGTDPAPDANALCYSGLNPNVAALLGGVAYASRPKYNDLCAAGLPPSQAILLGQD